MKTICFGRLLIPLTLIGSGVAAYGQLPAFPGAEGFAAHSTGGRGGEVYQVTNLNPNGPGSFLDAITTVPPAGRTIVFTVSGFIPINKAHLKSSKVTIAGQTAPGGGICLRGSSFTISGADVVIRHLRFRHGKHGNGGDCINPDGGARNIIDHCDVMFSADGPGQGSITFIPTPGFTGRGGFDFTVTDAEGSSWTQSCALLISK